MEKTPFGGSRRASCDPGRRTIVLTVLGAVAPALIAPKAARAFYDSGGVVAQPASSDLFVVGMNNRLRYVPDEIRIMRGDTVEWRNLQTYPHTITADPARVSNRANVELPEGAEPFDSGRVRGGGVWRRTFTVPGVYRYLCLPHERQGMFGTVIVG